MLNPTFGLDPLNAIKRLLVPLLSAPIHSNWRKHCVDVILAYIRTR